MIKYKTNGYGPDLITKVNIVKETKIFVFVDWSAEKNGSCIRRVAKMSAYECFFDTFDEAKSHLVGLFSQSAEGLERSLEVTRDQLRKLAGLCEKEVKGE